MGVWRMKRKHRISLLIALNFAILAVLGWFLFQTYTVLRDRIDALYAITQEVQTDVDIMPCDMPVFASMQTIGADTAHQRAIDFMGFGKRIFSQMEYDCAVYKFHARVDGGELLIQICGQNGQVLRAENPREVRRSNLTIDEGLYAAKQAIFRGGYDNMTLSLFKIDEHTVTAAFAPACGSVTPIEVVIGLDNGRVVGFFTKSAEA